MNNDIKSKENHYITVLNRVGSLPEEVWWIVLGNLKEKELGRVRTCCCLFNQLSESLFKNLWHREISKQESPLKYIYQLGLHPIKKLRESFSYCMRQIVLSDEVFKLFIEDRVNDTEKNGQSCLLALCDVDKPDCDNIIWSKNIEKLNNKFGEYRQIFTYWHYLQMIIIIEEFATDVLCCFLSLVEDAMKRKVGEGDETTFALPIDNAIGKAKNNSSWVVQVLLQKVMIQMAAKKPFNFLGYLRGHDGILESSHLHPRRREQLLNLIEGLTKSEDELRAAIAVSDAIAIRHYSDEAMERYMPLIENPKEKWVYCVALVIEGALARGCFLTDDQLLRLMLLMERCLAVDIQCFRVCIGFSKIPLLPPSVERCLLDLADEYLESTREYNVGCAITIHLILAKCTDKAICLYLPRLEVLPADSTFLALDLIAIEGRRLSSTTQAKVFQLINKYLETDKYLGEDLLECFIARHGVPRKVEVSSECLKIEVVEELKSEIKLEIQGGSEQEKANLTGIVKDVEAINLSTELVSALEVKTVRPYLLMVLLIILGLGYERFV